MKVEKEESISENFSEKNKRGRPRLLPPEMEKIARQGTPYCDIRTLHNQDYEARAVSVLGLSLNNPSDFPFLWLGDFSKVQMGKSTRQSYRKTILAELGRIKNNKHLIEAATEICSRKPTAQEAIQMIRNWRLGRGNDYDTGLESTLRKTIENYRKKHFHITNHDVYESLSLLEGEYFQKAMFGEKKC